MRIIKPSTVRRFAEATKDASTALDRWLDLAEAGEWNNLVDVRRSFRSADEVKVASGRTVVVFNIGGNKYRLITAIHYNLQKVFVLRFLSRSEYDQGKWKAQL